MVQIQEPHHLLQTRKRERNGSQMEPYRHIAGARRNPHRQPLKDWLYIRRKGLHRLYPRGRGEEERGKADSIRQHHHPICPRQHSRDLRHGMVDRREHHPLRQMRAKPDHNTGAGKGTERNQQERGQRGAWHQALRFRFEQESQPELQTKAEEPIHYRRISHPLHQQGEIHHQQAEDLLQ